MVQLVRDHFHSKCDCFRENVPEKRQQIVTSFRAVVQAVSPILSDSNANSVRNTESKFAVTLKTLIFHFVNPNGLLTSRSTPTVIFTAFTTPSCRSTQFLIFWNRKKSNTERFNRARLSRSHFCV